MDSESRGTRENLRIPVSSRLGKLTAIAALVAASWALGGCAAGTPPPDPPEGGGFDDRTVGALETVAEYEALAATGPGRSALKFVLTGFETPGLRATRFMDGTFYKLHDEWYWYRLLNGQRIPGLGTDPVGGHDFATIADIYDWAETQVSLPLDLVLSAERLYSNRFYNLALSRPRFFGLGSLLRVPRDSGVWWLFELEYSHNVTHQELTIFFAELKANLPQEIGDNLKWVVRSPDQELEALRIEQAGLPFADRIVRYSELATPGEVEVYSSGLTAGRVRVVRAGDDGLGASQEGDVLFLGWVPDYLPPASALITAVPQTPLAHVNVLARNRGIPNAYMGGLLDDPSIDQLARVRAPVIVRAAGVTDQLQVLPISEQEYGQWLQLRGVPPTSVPPVDTSRMPLTVDLARYSLPDVDDVRPFIGGKAAGFLALAAPGTVTMPDRPMVITVRSYVEHMESFTATIQAMFDDPAFRGDARMRNLVLEGPNRYDKRYPGAVDAAAKTKFLDDRPTGHALGDLVRAGGLKNSIRDKPLEAATLESITTAVATHFDGYAVSQGLRFRSSSNVEDIEGFNGAGLYDSNTGFLDAAAQTNERDRTRTVERAIKRTWSSYWGFEAYEERRLEKIDHRSGAMAVLVHARFDDPKELSNGVFTFTLLPDDHAAEAVLEVNVQLGAESVTNPVPGSSDLPEIDRVVLANGMTTIERVRRSTLVPAPGYLFTDEQLRSIFEQAQAVTEASLEWSNRAHDASRAQRTLTLDFEMRHMAEGWPALATGPAMAERIVIKQARSLEPGLRKIASGLHDLPLPRDVLARARRVVRIGCASDPVSAEILEAYTDPLIPPDLGFDSAPLTGSVTLTFDEAIAELGIAAGHTITVEHPDIAATMHPSGPRWSVQVELEATAAASAGLTKIHVGKDGSIRLEHGAAMWSRDGLSCGEQLLHSGPDDYLLQLLGR